MILRQHGITCKPENKNWRDQYFSSHTYSPFRGLPEIKIEESERGFHKCESSSSLRDWWENGVDVCIKEYNGENYCDDDVVVYFDCDGGHANLHMW